MADQYYGLTDPGKERSNNEDTFIAELTVNTRFIIAGVIDGVGGYAGGEIAASLARQAILQRLERPAGEVIPILTDSFNLANQNILAAKKEQPQHSGMACVATLALIDLERNQFHYAHVGDTRLYLLRDQSLVKITHDQSFVGFLEDSGRLTESEAMSHPKRNEIDKALGFELNFSKTDDYIETGSSPFLPGDVLLICSDGLTDMVPKAEITDILEQKKSLPQKCEALIAAANQHGGKDNITVVLVQNNKAGTNHSATKPAAVQKKNEPVFINNLQTPAKTTADTPPHTSRSTSAVWLWLVSIIALIFAGIIAWQYFNFHTAAPAAVPVRDTAAVTIKQVNQAQSKLQAMLDSAKGNTLVLNDTVSLNQPLQINRDSLFIKTKTGFILKADSGYKGAAIELGARCKFLFLDSAIIRNFGIGIISFNNSLLLKNVRFVNCPVAVQNQLMVADGKFISGSTGAFKADSLPVISKHK